MSFFCTSVRLLPPKLSQNTNPRSIPSIRRTLTLIPNPLFSSRSSISFQKLAINSSPQISHSHQQQSDHRSDPNNGDLTKHLPSALREIVSLFQSVGDDPKSKYQQLIYYASKLPALDPRFKNNDHRVRGCVSQVWIRAFFDPYDPSAVRFEADSDSVLTKGLAALLVLGLSGSPVSVISNVPSEFVHLLGLRQSLTPSRNNGFLNMLILMRKKASDLHSIEEIASNVNGCNPLETSVDETDDIDLNSEASITDIHGDRLIGDGTRAKSIKQILKNALSPVELHVEDISHLHVGRSGIRGSRNGETHFNLRIISEAFEGKSMVKRHRLVYELLQDELQRGLHSLSIVAKTSHEIKFSS